MPTILDPAWVLTGAGSINPIRQLATLKKATSNNYHAIAPAQISASWDTEGSAVSDDSPTFAGPSITIFTARAFIGASFEFFDDVQDLAAQVAATFADCKANFGGVLVRHRQRHDGAQGRHHRRRCGGRLAGQPGDRRHLHVARCVLPSKRPAGPPLR